MEWFFEFEVMDQDKIVLPKKEHSNISSGVATVPLFKGQQQSFDLDVREFVTITNASTLSVKVRRAFHIGTEKFVVGSEACALWVGGGAPAQANRTEKSGSAESTFRPSAKTPATMIQTSNGTQTYSAISNSIGATPRALAGPVTATDVDNSSSSKKVALGAVAGSVAVVLTILWRAARRKRAG
jgi:hypothetical protein